MKNVICILALFAAVAASAASPAASESPQVPAPTIVAGDTKWCTDGSPAPCVCIDVTDDGVDDCWNPDV